MLVTNIDESADNFGMLCLHRIFRKSNGFSALYDFYLRAVNPKNHPPQEQGLRHYSISYFCNIYRITHFLCLHRRNQLKKLAQFIDVQFAIPLRSDEVIKNLSQLCFHDFNSRCSIAEHFRVSLANLSYHLRAVQTTFQKLRKQRTQAMQEQQQKRVSSPVISFPAYLLPWCRKSYGYSVIICPTAEEFYSPYPSLPLFSAAPNTEVEKVGTLVGGLGAFSRGCRNEVCNNTKP